MSKNYSSSLFNEDRWVKRPDERVYMVDNLLYKYNLKGMPKDEVKKLLGEPTKTEYFKTPSNIVYYLGPERGFIRIDSEWLTIDFDDKGKVNSFGLARD
ncbi:MAG TPA: outer membrane protein assembly factor BamE [Clostridia bacterium]